MGFFTDYRSINQINKLIKLLEPKLSVLRTQAESLRPNQREIESYISAISEIMGEIFEIAGSASDNVKFAPFYLFGQKMSLMRLNGIVLAYVVGAKNVLQLT